MSKFYLLFCLVLFITACEETKNATNISAVEGIAVGTYAPKNWSFCAAMGVSYVCTQYPTGDWPMECNGLVGAWAGGAFEIQSVNGLFNGLGDTTYSFDGTSMVWYPSSRSFQIKFQNATKTEAVLDYGGGCSLLYGKQP